MTQLPELPSDTEQVWLRVLALLDLGRPREAAAETTRALAHSPDDALLWRLLSQIDTLLGEDAQALEAARRSVGLAPDFSGAHLSLGIALWNVQVRGKVFGRLPTWSGAWRAAQPALAAVGEALRLEPGSTEARLTLAQLHLLMGRPQLAQPLIADALRAEPNHPVAQMYSAEAWLQQKQPARAEAQLLSVLADDPQSAPALNLLSRVRLRQGRAEEAFTAALAAIRLGPADAGAQAHFKALVDEYLPLPFSRRSPAWRLVAVPHAVIIVPLLGLGVWVRTLYRVRQLSPQTRAQIRQVRSFTVNWRSPSGLFLALWAVILGLAFAVPHLPTHLQRSANGVVGVLMEVIVVGGLLLLIGLGVRHIFRWLRPR